MSAVFFRGFAVFCLTAHSPFRILADSRKPPTSPPVQRSSFLDSLAGWTGRLCLEDAPVFCSIDRWGNLASTVLRLYSVSRGAPGVDALRSGGERYSGHSMRRGFLTWATRNQWSLKALMAYIAPCAKWTPTRRSGTGSVSRVSQNDCAGEDFVPRYGLRYYSCTPRLLTAGNLPLNRFEKVRFSNLMTF